MTVLSNVQAADPVEFETTRLLVENMRRLGLEVKHLAIPWEQQADLVWFNRRGWQMTAWRMVGRPERLDPDEFVFHLFHSSYAKNGYNFVGYVNRRYDKLAEQQRRTNDRETRRKLIFEAQEIIARELPYLYVVHTRRPIAYRRDVWDPESIVEIQGTGIHNFWTWIEARPLGAQDSFLVNTGDVLQSINPFYISGDADSRVTEILWDRLMRIDKDGIPQPWAAESVEWQDQTHVLIRIRPGMKWHDGMPVTVDDVVFSFRAPAGGEVPMYQPFVEKISAVEAVDKSSVRFTLTEPWVAFEMASLAKVNLVPKHIWEPIIRRLEDKIENAESFQEKIPIGSGPYRFVAWKPGQEIILEANRDHFASPRAGRWILRIVPNVESALGQLRTGELNFLMEWEGDATILAEAAQDDPRIEMVATTGLGFRMFAMNTRLEPFNDVHFRRAVAHLLPKQEIIRNIFKGFAVESDSYISPVIQFWHNPHLPHYEFSRERARETLRQAGYRWDEEGRLLKPSKNP